LLTQTHKAKALAYWEKLGLSPGAYLVWTMHRPSNVDEPGVLREMVASLRRVATPLWNETVGTST
jgi:UDP-N-acetylglucosamine 2-epimerase (non-hydrolysing)